ncbi:hypothetical protein EKO27_g6428 [Xylaria grammica]|uniref:FAD/NAD(P)-binding domain-containing protein n=1 Tax=Xylaria grammica TaxID=363999 RepID=A0A439D2K9_9PEZI|nr:hypothetical protein EKO27_g6428 [Xylaria grammica]
MSSLIAHSIRVVGLSVVTVLLAYILRDEIYQRITFDSYVESNIDSTAEVLIIGGSHAGLSAALTLARHQIDVLILDSNAPRNKWKTPTHVVPTWENRDPDDLRRASREELRKTGFARFADTHVSTIKKPEANERVEFVFPFIEGYEENFPDHILHCLFTRGLEFKGSPSAGLLAMGLAGAPHHAAMLVEDAQKFAGTVTIYTNGDAQLGGGIRKALLERGEENPIIDNRKIIRLLRDPAGVSITIVLEDGEMTTESFLVHQPDTRANSEIVKQLGLKTNERNDIVTKMPFYQTSVAGIFAAGDCASPFKMIPNAIFQGSNAGAGIARELPRRVTNNEVNRLGEQKLTWYGKFRSRING